MPESQLRNRARLVDPIDRILEVLFGLIMVLTFTGTLSTAEAGREDVRVMLVGALGCNIAWGLIDGLFYLMACLAERGENRRILHALQKTSDAKIGQQLLIHALPPLVASHLTTEEIESLRQRVVKSEDPDDHPHLTRDDYIGAAAICALVILTTFPVAIPFLVMQEAVPALRVSNAIAVALMFITGYSLGKISGIGRWTTGIGMVLLGTALVLITIALGG